MTMNDTLLHIDSYPTPLTNAAIDEAVALAAKLGCRVSAQAFGVQIALPRNMIADRLIGLSGMVREEQARSLEAAKAALAHFTSVATPAGVCKDTQLLEANLYDLDQAVAVQGRTRDMTIVPISEPAQTGIAEAAIFQSGRPVLVFLPGKAGARTETPALVTVGWDGSRAAARALADALPILSRAREVRILTILNEKATAGVGQGAQAARHLAAHGISARVEEVDAEGRGIGAVVEDYVAHAQPDLLVMGAYGHSRLREFILGGATQYLLHAPPVPILFSH